MNSNMMSGIASGDRPANMMQQQEASGILSLASHLAKSVGDGKLDPAMAREAAKTGVMTELKEAFDAIEEQEVRLAAQNNQAMGMQIDPRTTVDKNNQGLAQLLGSNTAMGGQGPGIQQRGQMMAQQQQRPPQQPQQPQQGIASQPAPNMARMAGGGGIVSFRNGGESIANPNQPRPAVRESQGLSPDAQAFLKLYTTKEAALKSAFDDNERAMIEANFKRTTENISSDAKREVSQYTSQQGGMYGGGIVGYAPGGFVGPTEDMLVEKPRVIRDPETGEIIEDPVAWRAQKMAEARATNAERDKRIAALPTTQINPQTGTPEDEGGGFFDRLSNLFSQESGTKTGTELWNDFLWMFSDEAARQSRKTTGDFLGREGYAGTGVDSEVFDFDFDPLIPPQQVQEETPSAPVKKISDEELEEYLRPTEDPGPIREETAKDEDKREIDMRRLTNAFAGMAGKTSGANALAGAATADQIYGEQQTADELKREELEVSREQVRSQERAASQRTGILKMELDLKNRLAGDAQLLQYAPQIASLAAQILDAKVKELDPGWWARLWEQDATTEARKTQRRELEIEAMVEAANTYRAIVGGVSSVQVPSGGEGGRLPDNVTAADAVVAD